MPALNGYKEAAIGCIIGQNSNTPAERELLKPLFEWVKEALPTLYYISEQAWYVGAIMNKNRSATEKEFLKPLFEAVQKTKSIMNANAKSLEADIIGKNSSMLYESLRPDIRAHFALGYINQINSISPDEREFLKVLIEVIYKALSTWHIDYAKQIARGEMLEKKAIIGDLLTPEQWQQVEQLAH